MRYQNKPTLIVRNQLYQEYLIDKNLNFIEIEQVPNLSYPSPKQQSQLEIVGHTWKVGDRLYKLAHKYYGDSKLWWVISYYNKAPTEAHFALGDIVEIPLPLDKLLEFIGY